MLRRLRIRAKLILIAALPLTCLLGIVLAVSATRLHAVTAASGLAGQVRLSVVLADVVHEIQIERGLSAGLVGGGFRADDRRRLDDQRARVDAARARLRDAADVAAGTDAADALRPALGRLAAIDDHRGSVDARAFGVSATLGWYGDTIDALLRGPAALARAAPDTQLLAQLTAYTALSRAKEAIAHECGLLNGVFRQGSFQPDQYRELLALVGTQRAQRNIFDAVASPARRNELAAAHASPEMARVTEIERQALTHPNDRLEGQATEWWDAVSAKVDRYREIEQGLAGDVTTAADAAAAQARLQLAMVLGGGLALVAATGAVVTLITRMILRPVNTLTDRAYRAARSELPRIIGALEQLDSDIVVEELPPVEVGSEDEMAELAAAFSSVQRTAVDLAADQARLRRNVAEMFVNLGRRNQSLIGRQLAFIDRLERHEADPDQLEKLFRLDHMSTRMRRNAESLLVLAGAELPLRWTAAVPVADVVRAGLSEIEDYTRIEMSDVDPVGVTGPAATDLTHLLAELLENATLFSPPTSRVEVHGARRRDGYLLAVVDHGVGMSAEQLAEANRRIDELARFDRSPSKTLGLYVVGRLAARHDINVRLTESVTSGITAKVLLPEGLLEPLPEMAPAALDAPAVEVRPVAVVMGSASVGAVDAPPAAGAGPASPDDPPPLARRTRRSRTDSPRALQVVPDEPVAAAVVAGPPAGDPPARDTPARDMPAGDHASLSAIAADGENSLRALRRRVRGAQLPDSGPPAGRRARSEPRPGPSRAGEVRASIGAFQRAVERGRQAARPPDPPNR